MPYAGDFSYLLQLGATELGRSFGMTVPEISPFPPDRAISASASLQQIAVGLQGSFTAGGMAAKIGLPWPLADDLGTITDPRAVYTVVPASFLLEAVLGVPLLRIHRHLATVVVRAGGHVELMVGVLELCICIVHQWCCLGVEGEGRAWMEGGHVQLW